MNLKLKLTEKKTPHREGKMTFPKKIIDTILVVSVSGWLMLLLAVLLPTTGLIMENPSGIINESLLTAFLLLGSVASATSFIRGAKMFRTSEPVPKTPPITIEPEQDRNNQTIKTVDEKAQNPENQKQYIGTFETEKLGLPEHKGVNAWRREEYWVKGKLRVAFREIESGHYMKNPLRKPRRAKRKARIPKEIQRALPNQ
jgi:hypothetical protein